MGLISITGIDYTAARNSLPAKLLAELLLEKGKDLVGSTECFTNLDINIFHQNLLDLGQTIIQEKKRLGVPGERCLATVEETLQVVFMHPKLDKARRTSRERALFQAMTYLEMAERACSGTNLQKVTPEQLRIVKTELTMDLNPRVRNFILAADSSPPEGGTPRNTVYYRAPSEHEWRAFALITGIANNETIRTVIGRVRSIKRAYNPERRHTARVRREDGPHQIVYNI